MSIFGTIVEKIFHPGKANAAPAQTTPTAYPAGTHFAPTPSGSSADMPPQPAQQQQMASGDVNQILAGLAAKADQKLNWKESIVDLLKLLDLDSSISARTKLAQELGFTGDTKDSAKMNLWLQSQVMDRLSKNGGQVPSELLH